MIPMTTAVVAEGLRYLVKAQPEYGGRGRCRRREAAARPSLPSGHRPDGQRDAGLKWHGGTRAIRDRLPNTQVII